MTESAWGATRLLDPPPLKAEAFFARRRRDDIPEKIAILRRSFFRAPSCVLSSVHCQAEVFIDTKGGQVWKRVGDYAEYDILAREARLLRRARRSGRFPCVLGVEGDTIRLTYLGEPVCRANLPADWRSQAEDILAALAAAGVSHNDIREENLLVARGRLSLIDFGWATRRDAPIPPRWPQEINSRHRLAIHRFDDRKAIFDALTAVERNERPWLVAA